MKLSEEERELLLRSCLDDSTKINSFLSELFEEQSKSQNKQFQITIIVAILTFIVAVITLIVTILK